MAVAVLALGGTTSEPDIRLTKNTARLALALAFAVMSLLDELETMVPVLELPLAVVLVSVKPADVTMLLFTVLIAEPLGGNWARI